MTILGWFAFSVFVAVRVVRTVLKRRREFALKKKKPSALLAGLKEQSIWIGATFLVFVLVVVIDLSRAPHRLYAMCDSAGHPPWFGEDRGSIEEASRDAHNHDRTAHGLAKAKLPAHIAFLRSGTGSGEVMQPIEIAPTKQGSSPKPK